MYLYYFSFSAESLQNKNLAKIKQFKRNVKRYAEVVQGQYFSYVNYLIFFPNKIK